MHSFQLVSLYNKISNPIPCPITFFSQQFTGVNLSRLTSPTPSRPLILPPSAAFKYGDGRKIDGKRVVVDIERGRTVKNWRPRRLGGGLGGTRIGAPDQNIAHSGRVEPREYTEKLARASRQRERALRRSKSPSAER